MTTSAMRLAMAAGVAMSLSGLAMAQSASGGHVVAGQASIDRSNPAHTRVTAGDRSIIQWQSLGTAPGQTLEFIQPSATSRVLNRVMGPDPSVFAGSLKANGVVYITNPAGVFFTRGSVVNVGGIYAAAGSISDQSFLGGVKSFTNVSGVVENLGVINATGEVGMVGRRVANFGVINAPGGMVAMGAGDEVMVGDVNSSVNGGVFARVNSGAAGPVGGTGVTQAGEVTARRVSLGAGDMYAMAIDHPGRTTASEISIQGGRGTASTPSTVSISGELDVSSATGKGGAITVTGQQVGLFGATIDASGRTGGGDVRIGGDKMGQGTLQRADAVYVSQGSTIDASAQVRGNGGRVIVWSDRYTNFRGEIDAKGGSAGGHGGFVETSSKVDLAVNGSVDASAARGRAGQWLLDPTTVNITTDPTSNGSISSGVFTPTAANTANVNVNDIAAALQGGTSVTINTTSSGSGDGDINLLTALNVTPASAVSLTLNAVRDIVISSALTGGGAGLRVDLNAGRDARISAPITTGGGALNVSTGRDAILTANLTAGAGNISIGGPVKVGVSTVSGNNITFSGAINDNATGGELRVNPTGTATFGGLIGSDAILGRFETGSGGTSRFNAAAVNATQVVLGGPTLAGADVTFRGPTSVTVNGTLNSVDDAANDVTLRSANVTINGVVGDANARSALGTLSIANNRTEDTSVATINTGVVKAATVSSSIRTVLQQDVTITATDTASLSGGVDSADGQARNLTVNAPTTTFGVIGSTPAAALGDIRTDAPGTTRFEGNVAARSIVASDTVTIAAATVNTSQTQTYEGAVLIGATTTLDATNVTFNNTVNSSGADRQLTINTRSNGTTTFNAPIGTVTPLASLTTNADGRTILAGAQVITSGPQTYGDAITLATTNVITGSVIQFTSTIDSDNLARSLTVNSSGSGLTTFNANIGATNPLARLETNADGDTRLNAASINIGESIIFRDRVRLGADTALRAPAISLLGGAISESTNRALSLESTGNGTVTLGGAIGGTTTSESLASLTVAADGTTVLNGGSIRANLDQTFNNAVRVGGDTNMVGRNVTFNGTVNSDTTTPRAISIETAPTGETRFNGAVGGVNPLASITTDANGTTRINADLTTRGFMLFNDPVLIARNVRLSDDGQGGSSNTNPGITFGNTLNSVDGNHQLTILTQDTQNAAVDNPRQPRISFLGNVGGTRSFSRLTLGSDRSTSASAATIIGGIRNDGTRVSNFDLTVNADQFVMGRGQKFTSAGGLTINSATSAVVGDLSALRNLAVNSPSITIQRRPGGALLSGLPGSGGSTLLTTVRDTGVDLVAGGTISFSTVPGVTGEGIAPQVATPDGSGISGTLSQFATRNYGPISATNISSGSLGLDLRAEGPSNVNIATTIAGASPRPISADQVAASQELAAEQLEGLSQIGIEATGPSKDQVMDVLTGRSIAVDAPTGLGTGAAAAAATPEAQISSNRLSPTAVDRVLASYKNVLIKETKGPNGEVIRERQDAVVKASLEAAWRDYSAAAGARADAVGFRAYLEAVPTQAQPLFYLDGLRDLFRQMSTLGLTPAETRAAKDSVLGSVTPSNMNAATLETAIMAQFLGAPVR